jgi:hypothetical protein
MMLFFSKVESSFESSVDGARIARHSQALRLVQQSAKYVPLWRYPPCQPLLATAYSALLFSGF